MNEHADQPATPGNDAGLPGKTLQSQREAMGWSVEQVADQLKLAPRQVMALEAGNYASLPSPAVTRGFVRAYAKLLKIDAAPLVAKIEMNMPPEAQAGAAASIPRREQRPAAFSQSRFPIGGKRSRVPVGLIAGAIAVLAAGAALWHFGLIPTGQQDADTGAVLENPVVTTPGAAMPATQDPLLNPSVPLISVPAPGSENTSPATAPGNAPATAPATTPVAPAATAPATAPGPAPAATPPGAAPATPVAATLAAPAAATPAAAAGANALVFNVREDAWIEVRPAKGGKPLISRLVKAGSTETIDVAEPVKLVVGNPTAVSATLRGASVELPQVPGKTIARLALK
ncbi:RodZ domain-containing protein [Telluria aromaticivorans]|uniref:Helix-turn-helix domain-containing protein n=1 Tax=Telluria aromaticivorans TaxID=2725995 RepID=A0A7Y2JWF5_9BURK|nr:RodZ domain-containing protein [Telluria aromaticivorans]NNG22276.1 helix-turn-helix domain-containing protein [Telluria aromaticivorans]